MDVLCSFTVLPTSFIQSLLSLSLSLLLSHSLPPSLLPTHHPFPVLYSTMSLSLFRFLLPYRPIRLPRHSTSASPLTSWRLYNRSRGYQPSRNSARNSSSTKTNLRATLITRALTRITERSIQVVRTYRCCRVMTCTSAQCFHWNTKE